MPYNNKNISRILKYLNNELSDKERYAFEREMEADPFLMEAMEGYEKTDLQQLIYNLTTLENKISNQKNKNPIPIWMKVAASLLFIIGITSLFFISNKNTNQPLLSKQQKIVDSDSLIVNNFDENKSEPLIIEEEKEEIKTIETIEEKQSTYKATANKRNKKENNTPQIKITAVQPIIEDNIEIADTDLIMDEELEFELASDTQKNVITGTLEGNKIDSNSSLLSANKNIDQSLSKDFFFQFNGKVIDEEGTPIPGVTIIEAGKPNGTITDLKGNFSIQTRDKESLLTFDFIGYKQKSLLVKNDSIGEITLEDDAMALDEVITLGYGTQHKKRTMQRNTQETKSSEDKIENNLIPYPEIGYKKFKRKIERSLELPTNSSNTKIHVNIFISDSGEISNIKIITPVEDTFATTLKKEIKKLGLWKPAIVNNKPTKGSRLVIFEF